MTIPWRRAGHGLWARPWIAVLVVSLGCALAFPGVAAGTIGLLCLCGLAGAGVVTGWPRFHLHERISPRVAGWIAIAVVIVAAVAVFGPIAGHARPWPRGDWGPQHAVLRGVVDHLRDLELPHWNHRISTGDPPLDVYPAFTYVVTGLIAIALNMDTELPTVLLWTAVVAHVALAVGATRLALRFVSAPIAAAIGLLMLVDLGSVSSGGVIGTIRWGLLHTAIGQALSLFAVVSVVDAVRRPRMRTSISIWVFTALSVAAHPSALLSALVVAFALVVVALLASDVPARRPLFALGHLATGVALAAFIWLPMGERILLYGQHFGNVLKHPVDWLTQLFNSPAPEGSFAVVVYAGYAGAIAALWSRRAVPVLIAAIVLAMLVALSDAAYLGFDLMPSKTVARLGSDRFYGLIRPFVFVAAGYLASVIRLGARASWSSASRRSILIAGVLFGIVGGAGLRFGCQTAKVAAATARTSAVDDIQGFEPLERWAAQQMRTLGPDRWARAFFYDTSTYFMHLTATTGMPTFGLGPIPDVLLRERILGYSADSLRRFNVRWVITDSSQPPAIGDPATEQHVGDFTVREIAGWDGRFARVESGGGRAVVKRLDDDAVDVELVETTAPSLVVLGTGYYPRWRAVDASGNDVPIYAYPATPGGRLHVVAAWVRPGITRFSPDGSLPSDGRGRLPSLAALALAIAIIVTWSWRRHRRRALRVFARMRAITPRFLPIAARAILGVALLALVGSGLFASAAPVGALELGTGVRSMASVSFKHGDRPWADCGYARSLGEYQCGDFAIVSDTTGALVTDEQWIWPYITPAIQVRPLRPSAFSVRVRVHRRLSGRYWMASKGSPVEVTIAGEAAILVDKQQSVELDDRDRDLELTGTATPGGGFSFAFVREDTLVPDQDLPSAPDVAR